MQVWRSILFLSLSSIGVLCATITLYEVAVPTPTSTFYPILSEGLSFSITPGGVGEDGRTTYLEEGVLTKEVAIFSNSTFTFSQPTTTFTLTIEEDASGRFRSESISISELSAGPAAQAILSCNFQGTTAGSCVDQLHFPNGPTLTTTYSGSLIPVWTLTETASIPAQTQGSGALTRHNIWDTYELIGLLSSISAAALLFF